MLDSLMQTSTYLDVSTSFELTQLIYSASKCSDLDISTVWIRDENLKQFPKSITGRISDRLAVITKCMFAFLRALFKQMKWAIFIAQPK